MLKNLFTKPRKIIDSLFLGTALLIIIPIIILGLSLTWIFSSGFMKQTDRINTNTVDYVVELLGENISAVYNTAYILGNDNNILKYSSLKRNSYEYADNLNKIMTVLGRQKLQSDIIEEIYIFYKESTEIVSTIEGKFETKEKLQNYYGMSLEELAEFITDNNMSFVSENNQYTNNNPNILFAKCIDTKFNESGNIYAIYVLNGRFINGLIDMISLEDVGYSMLLDGQYNLLLGDENIYKKYENYLSNLKKHGSDKKADARMLLKEVERDRLYLGFVVDDSHYVSMIRSIWATIICIGVFIVVISVFISRFYIRRLYRPFGNIVNMFKPEEEEYGLKSELEFFEEKYIEIKIMKSELEFYKNAKDSGLQELFIYNFLKGFYKSDYRLYMQDINISFEKAYYTVFTVKIDNFKAIVQNIKLSHYRKFIKDKLVNILQNHNPKQYRELFYFYDGEYIGLLICHDVEIESIKQDIAYLQRELLKLLEITVSVCISDTVTSPEELMEEYKMLSNAMLQMKFCKPSTVLTMQDYKKIGKYVNFSQYKNTITQYISERNYTELDALIDSLFVESRVFYTEIIQMVTGFLTITTDLLEKREGKSLRIYAKEIHPYDEIGRMGSVVEIAAYIKNLCHDVGDNLYAESTTKNELYDKIIDYISSNYMKDISLTVMAKDFGLSSSYFSRSFKEVTGKNYSEMISSYRVAKAKELIDCEDEIKMFQVAELVGFASYKAFAEAFKKYSGMSPEAYKKSQNEQKSFEL